MIENRYLCIVVWTNLHYNTGAPYTALSNLPFHPTLFCTPKQTEAFVGTTKLVHWRGLFKAVPAGIFALSLASTTSTIVSGLDKKHSVGWGNGVKLIEWRVSTTTFLDGSRRRCTSSGLMLKWLAWSGSVVISMCRDVSEVQQYCDVEMFMLCFFSSWKCCYLECSRFFNVSCAFSGMRCWDVLTCRYAS